MVYCFSLKVQFSFFEYIYIFACINIKAMKIKTKKLEIRQESNKLKGILKNSQFRRTILGILIGAVAGFAFFYFSEGIHMVSLSEKDVIQSMIFGGLFGLFVTNSPCARNRC